MDINAYLAKQYPSPPCWALVADVYNSELADTVTDYKTVNASVRAVAAAFRLNLHKSAHGFAQIAAPVEFAVVLLGKTRNLGLHHAGVYVGGKVLHALESGVYHQPLETLTDEYKLVEFWAKS